MSKISIQAPPSVGYDPMPSLPGHIRFHEDNLLRTLPFTHLEETKIDAYLQGQLTEFEQAAIKFHLVVCKKCHARVPQLVKRMRYLQSHPVPRPDASHHESAAAARLSRRVHIESEVPRISLDQCKPVESHAPGERDWGSLRLQMSGGDSPGILSLCTDDCAERDLMVDNLVFSVMNDGSQCHLSLKTDGDWQEICDLNRRFQDGSILRGHGLHEPRRTRLVSHPHLFAFAAQLDDAPGLVWQVAKIATDPHPCPEFSGCNPEIARSGSILALVGHTKVIPVPQGVQQMFYLQGLIACPDRGVQKAVLDHLLHFFRKNAMRFYIGNFGVHKMHTQFGLAADVPERSYEWT